MPAQLFCDFHVQRLRGGFYRIIITINTKEVWLWAKEKKRYIISA